MEPTPRPPAPPDLAVPLDGETSRRVERAGLWGGLALFALLLVLPAPEGMPPAAWRVAAVGALVATWWMTEALPMAAAALVPLVAFPLLGVATPEAAGAPYANPVVFLFLGGFLLALAVEKWGLHRRLALGVIAAVGLSPRRILLGFLVVTGFLSLWISNTATALMMLPIALSLARLVPADGGSAEEATGPGNQKNFAVALLLGLAYAASIGGIGTLIGTPTNALLAGFLRETYGYRLSFVAFMLVGMPVGIVGTALLYGLLVRLFPVAATEVPGSRAFVARERAALGPLTAAERRAGLVFAAVAALWIGSPLVERVVPGVNDTGVALAGALLLFVLPAGGATPRGTRLLTWTDAERLPWGVLLLFGGGLSLAAAIQASGLAVWIGGRLGALNAVPPVVLILAVCVVVVAMSELASNTATAAAFLPVVAALAVGVGENPLLLAVPATLAASCGFALPVATPPNAIAYGTGLLRTSQMGRAGLALNVLMILVVVAASFALLGPVLGVVGGTVPAWATAPPTPPAP